MGGASIEAVPIPRRCTDGFFLALWDRPEMHLDPDVRRGSTIWHEMTPAESGTGPGGAGGRSRERSLGRAPRPPARETPSSIWDCACWSPSSEPRPMAAGGRRAARYVGPMGEVEPLRLLEDWIEEARGEGIDEPASAAFVTADAEGRPSARTVTLKRIEDGALRLHDRALDPQGARRRVESACRAALPLALAGPPGSCHGPRRGRASRDLAEELFVERDPSHQPSDGRLAPGRAGRRPRAAARPPRASVPGGRGAPGLPAGLGGAASAAGLDRAMEPKPTTASTSGASSPETATAGS